MRIELRCGPCGSVLVVEDENMIPIKPDKSPDEAGDIYFLQRMARQFTVDHALCSGRSRETADGQK